MITRRRWLAPSWTYVVVCLVGCTLLVLAVAWTLNLATRLRGTLRDNPPLIWPARVPTDWPRAPRGRIVSESLVRHVDVSTSYRESGPFTLLLVERLRLGVPFRALESTNVREDGMGAGQTVTFSSVWDRGLLYGTPPNASMPVRHILPLRPITLGLIGNVLVYFAVCEGLRLTWSVRRRRLRIRQGRCLECGYLTGDAARRACPECGAMLGGDALAPGLTTSGT